MRSSCSSASNSPVWWTISAPRDQGPRSPLQTACAEPVWAVHHTASPRPASSQCSAWTREANAAPCVCATARGPLAVSEDHSTKATSRDEVSCVGTSPAEPARGWPASSTSWTSGAKDIWAIAPFETWSAMISDAPVVATWASSTDGADPGRHGTVTTPALMQPSMTSSQLAPPLTRTRTRSPGATPRSRRSDAQCAAASDIWRKVRGSMIPS